MPTPIAAVEGDAPSSPRKRRVTSTLPAAASTGGGAAGPAAGTTAALRLSDSQPAVEDHVPSSASGSSRLRVLRNRLAGVRDELAGVDRGIQEEKALREKLGEKLDNIDEQLSSPGLSAKDKDHLLAKWRSVDDNKRVSNAALAGLYDVQRRHQSREVALQQEIGAEEAARSKADTELPSVVQRLEATEVSDARAQYSRRFLANAGFELRGSDGVVDAIDACVLQNLAPTGEKSNVLVVNGPSGSGKTRVGFEALCRSTGLSGDLLRALEQKAGCPVLTIPLFIDFNNGFSYLDGVDGGNMDQNLGVRLAARALRVSAARVRRDNGRSLDGLETAEVLTAIAKGALRRASEAAASPPGVILLAPHLDEYQFYLQRLITERGYSEERARLCFKDMLSAANNWVLSAGHVVGVELVFFPVVTGTPVAGLPLDLTSKLSQSLISPGRLLMKSSVELLADVLTDGAERSQLRPGAVEALLASHQARNALGDTDFLPRHVVDLGKEALKVLPAAGDGAALVSGIDWALAMGPLVMATLPLRRVENASTLALLALSQVPVQLNRTPFPFQRDVTNAVVAGVVKLEPVGDDFYVVRVPLIQLGRWGLASILPAHLLSQTVCTWEQVELIVGYCLTAALRPGLRSSPLFVHNLFPGALGCDELRPRELILEEPCSLYVEETQFITPGRRVPLKRMAVQARKEFEMVHDEVMLTNGVFLACLGNMAVDIRFSLPVRRRGERRGMLHEFVQTKQTGTSRKVSDGDVDAWYQSVTRATANWATDEDQVLYVYFTNKHLTDDGVVALHSKQFFKARPGLVVVSFDQLSCVLPPFLLTRFTTAAQEQR
ncbi:hypothetical protein I4F81_011034 [Pyropia yezoensis]|uniref:Uncharacterized protein n=1 Tax=Pyropia yezoensis TaxID=2788 RepID=A0ACC3CE60_PYRYE|nr:hypothetical protein I4F81_011034 [Neopyropia yezoensis]